MSLIYWLYEFTHYNYHLRDPCTFCSHSSILDILCSLRSPSSPLSGRAWGKNLPGRDWEETGVRLSHSSGSPLRMVPDVSGGEKIWCETHDPGGLKTGLWDSGEDYGHIPENTTVGVVRFLTHFPSFLWSTRCPDSVSRFPTEKDGVM